MDIHFVEKATFDTEADDLRPPEPGFESKRISLNGCLQLGNSKGSIIYGWYIVAITENTNWKLLNQAFRWYH